MSQFTHPAPQNPVPQRPAPQFPAPPYAVPQYVIPQKKPVWKRWWFIVIVVVVVLGAIGSLGDRGSSSVVSKPTETAVEGVHQSQQSDQAQTPESTEAAAPADAEPAVSFPGQRKDDTVVNAGEAATIRDVTVTATPLVAGDSTLGPTVCSSVTLTNGSSSTVSFNLFDWSLQQPSGTIINSGFLGSSDILHSGDIVPGGMASGDVCFDADPSVSGQYILLYEPMVIWSNKRAAWLNSL